MKRFAPLYLLLILACSNNPSAPTIPSVTLKREAVACELIGSPIRGVSGEYRVGNVWFWHFEGFFSAGPCDNTLRVKVWFVSPDGSMEMFGAQETTAVHSGLGTGHQIALDAKAPVLDSSSLPERWFPRFFVEVSNHGQVIGSYVTSASIPLIPNVPHGRNTHSVK